ncbi:MAG: hypothetical protein AAF688_08780 [Bacteroidota bacterium]
MSKIEDIVDSLENKVSKMLHKMEVLKQSNAKLQRELISQQEKSIEQQKQLEAWVEKCDALKVANSLLGSNDNNRETKLKINTLIRDIDHCISQLSE